MDDRAKVVILGSGTCRIDPQRVESSMCFIDGETTFLFDCGSGVPRRLVEAGGLENCKKLHIHLSHAHVDHIAGLPSLLQCLTYSDDRRDLKIEEVVIHSTEDVKEIIQGVLKLFGTKQTNLIGYYQNNIRVLKFESFGNEEDSEYLVNNILVKSVYLPDAYNHGVKFKINSINYAITGDCTQFGDKLIKFCRNADIILFDFGHLTNVMTESGFEYCFENIVELLKSNSSGKFYAGHILLRSIEDIQPPLQFEDRKIAAGELIKTALELAKDFSGTLELAEDLLDISID